jgi:mRNA guanylyltransferase
MPHSSAPPSIPGQQVPPEVAEQLREQVAGLLGRNSTRFPGAQPVSFARQHLNELQRSEYFMCEKTDGVRCLLFLSFTEFAPEQYAPVTFLIDRKNNYYDVQPPLRIPYYLHPNDESKFLFNVIIDGELVTDRVDIPGKPPRYRLMFYAFDLLVFDGDNLTPRSLDKRYGRLQEFVSKPYSMYHEKKNVPKPEIPFYFKVKQMYTPYSFKDMFERILPDLPHGNDGLVFTAKKTRYEFGTDQHILKWKPPHENTIDFKLRLGSFPLIDPDDGQEGMIEDYDAPPDKLSLEIMHDRGDYRWFADLHFTPSDWEVLKSLHQRLDGRIIECYRHPDGGWRYKQDDDGTPRWRDDKKDANHVSTVKSVLQSIEDPVTEEMLLANASEIRGAVHRIRAEEARVQQQQMQMQMKQEGDREGVKKRKISEVNGGH